MSVVDPSFPIVVEERYISANLNSSMLFNFLMGIYTMIYGGVMYIYLSRKPANTNHRIVLSAISVLYFLSFLNFVNEWYYLDWTFAINGATRESIFIATGGDGSKWSWVFSNLLIYSLFIISDGLLVGLFIASTIFSVIVGPLSSTENAILSNNVSSALSFILLGTTVATTCLIGYKIHSASRSNDLPSKRLFNRVVVLVVESAAVYSLVLLLNAIIAIVPSFNWFGSPLGEVQYYLGVLLTVVSGMAPTILVARIALTNPNNTVASAPMTHISGLQFGSHHGSVSSRSGDVFTSSEIDDALPSPVVEVKRESNDMSGGNQV
ncbi:hypothetical protein CVT25_001705 [Psilocybe cyanescens]|uniref:Uncharacterized protein n=1 Tax=Psilocybe cyanescens TaxID=93625 RepID=A0A409WPF4_PSICY|nr:hypothetical protein CVT25_001705 [Psilocybe cyanescens]